MRLYTFEREGQLRIGAEHAGQLVDLGAVHAALAGTQRDETRDTGSYGSTPFPADMLAFIRAGEPALEAARQAIIVATEQPDQRSTQRIRYSFEEVRLHAPLQRPGKILCSGVNYRGHVDENPGATLPETPGFFAKLPSTVIGPDQPILYPKLTQQLDYEVELAVVVGRTMRKTPEHEALARIFGYTILHDVSARDVQFKAPRDNQITLGKNFDTFAPLGPCIVTADELPEPGNLRLRTFVNGQLLQDGTTREWVFPLPQLLSFLSQIMTLEPGDIVTTGTPAGVGIFRHPPRFLQPGDHVILEIEGIGRLENPVVAED